MRSTRSIRASDRGIWQLRTVCRYLMSLFGLLATLQLSAQVPDRVYPLWSNGAPGFESRKDLPEHAKDWWIRDINNPSLNVYVPHSLTPSGTAVLVCPGGGFTSLVYNAEGRDAARFLNSLGITAFVLKYRLFREPGSPYTEENARQDVFRGMRLMRELAPVYQLNPHQLGILGFSAGGELAGWVSYHYEESHALVGDATDRQPARPDFQILVYPGPLAVPDSVPSQAPSTLLIAANGDTCCSASVVQLLLLHRKAGVPVEVHLYAFGAHAFNMGQRSPYLSLRHWPDRMADWLKDNGWIPRLSNPSTSRTK